MLEFDHFIPDGVSDGAPLIVLLHGRGASKEDLAGLRPRLPEEAILVLPQAPFSGSEWGYGPGWAWYRYLGGNTPEPETFEESQTKLANFLESLPNELPVTPGPLALGGFSQGGTMSLAHALRNPGRVPFVLNFSGFLADHPSVDATPDTVRGTRIFWGHGQADPAISIELAHAGRSALLDVGADLETRDYPIGHWIDPSELADAVAWLRKGLAARNAEGE